MAKARAEDLLLDAFRAYKRNCKTHRLIGNRGTFYCRAAKGWCLDVAALTIRKAPFPVTRSRGTVKAVHTI